MTDFDPFSAKPKKGSWLPPPRVVWTLRVSPGGTAGWCGTRSYICVILWSCWQTESTNMTIHDISWHRIVWVKISDSSTKVKTEVYLVNVQWEVVQSSQSNHWVSLHYWDFTWFPGRKIRSTSALDIFRSAPGRCGVFKSHETRG